MADAMKDVQMRDLYAPHIVSIRIRGSERLFQVPKPILCAKSVYFETAFQEKFKEGQESIIELGEHVKAWILECFIGWLYTTRIFWQPLEPPAPGLASPRSIANTPSEVHKMDPNDPVTWRDCDLVDLYIFADEHDTRVLRNDVLDVIMQKALQTWPCEYLWPRYAAMTVAFENLPRSSSLHKFYLDALVYIVDPDDDEEDEIRQLASFSQYTLQQVACKRMRLIKAMECSKCKRKEACDVLNHKDMKLVPAYERDLCEYHEHANELEKRLCAKKWKNIKRLHKID